MFKQNKYKRWYDNIITNARERIVKIPVSKVGYERHHIIPRSLGGSDKNINLVYLTYREHFICHRLLVKFTSGVFKAKMYYALNCMSNMNKNDMYSISSHTYKIIKENYSQSISAVWTKEKRAFHSQRVRAGWTVEAKKLAGIRSKERWLIEDFRENQKIKNIESWTPERRIKASQIQKELLKDPIVRAGRARLGSQNGMFGKTHTDAVKKAQGERVKLLLTGKTYEEIYGVERAAQLKTLRSEQHKGVNHQGQNNPRYNPELVSIKHISGKEFTGTRTEIFEQCNIPKPYIVRIMNDKPYKGWSLA